MTQFKKIGISLFVVFWILLFHYESLRAFYLSPLFGRELPKLPLLFPPAGWIMFYQLEDDYSTAEVYGLKASQSLRINKEPRFIDPHQIFTTRFVGFDNIHRNMMVNVLYPQRGRAFCQYLRLKFPEEDDFVITHAIYPKLTGEKPLKKFYKILYRCSS